MVIGAGGASRAAVFALLEYLGCSVIYLVNRDVAKAQQLVADMTKSGFVRYQDFVIVVESVGQARTLDAPFYSVG
jgi:quinate dehydrogenase